MKLSVLLVAGGNEEDDILTIDSISAQSGTVSAEDIFLVIAGSGLDEDKKNRYLERASKIGLTAFINRSGSEITELYNTFITHANADKCTVLHSGSRIDGGYFSGIFEGFEKYPQALIGTGRKISKGKRLNENDVFSAFCEEGLIDLDKDFGCMPWFFEGTVIDSKFCAENLFDTEKGKYCETLGLMKMLAQQESFLFSNSGALIYVDSRGNSGEFFEGCKNGSSYLEILDELLIPLGENVKRRDGRTPMFVQYFVLIMLVLRFNANRGERCNGSLQGEELADFFKKAQRALRPVEDKVICNAYGVKIDEYSVNDIRFMLGVKHGKMDYSFDMTFSRDRLYAGNKDFMMYSDDQMRINIVCMEYREGKLEIDGEYPDIFSDKRIKTVAVYNGERYGLKYNRLYSSTEFFGVQAYRKKTFHVSIPVFREGERSVEFYILFKGFEYRIRNTYESHYSRICDVSENDYWALDDEMICCCVNGMITTVPLPKKKRRSRDRKVLKEIRRSGVKGVYFTRLAYHFTKRFFAKKKIWIFCDDIQSGHGPAETMFKYAMTQHDDLYCYYLIDKDTADTKRLKNEAYRPLYSGTLSHRLILLNGGLMLTGKADVMELNGFDLERSAYFRGIYDFDRIMIQHEDDAEITPLVSNRLHDNVSIFCAGTQETAAELLQPEYGYEKQQVIFTGCPAYDYTIEDLVEEEEEFDILAVLDEPEEPEASHEDSSCKQIYEAAIALFKKRRE